MFIFRFLCSFLKVFCVGSYLIQIISKQIYLANREDLKKYYTLNHTAPGSNANLICHGTKGGGGGGLNKGRNLKGA